MTRLLIIGIIVALVVIRLIYGAWAYDEFYVKGRSPLEQRTAATWRARAIAALLASVALEWLGRQFPAVPLLPSLALVAAGVALLLAFRAGQRVSLGRTIAAATLVLAGGAAMMGGIILLRQRADPQSLTPTHLGGAGLLLFAVVFFIAASRLSRPKSPSDHWNVES